eukprot:scaffold4691_cov62-Phaeocystis_antarctica.AAC.2
MTERGWLTRLQNYEPIIYYFTVSPRSLNSGTKPYYQTQSPGKWGLSPRARHPLAHLRRAALGSWVPRAAAATTTLAAATSHRSWHAVPRRGGRCPVAWL